MSVAVQSIDSLPDPVLKSVNSNYLQSKESLYQGIILFLAFLVRVVVEKLIHV
jgi:hypothetical protein